MALCVLVSLLLLSAAKRKLQVACLLIEHGAEVGEYERDGNTMILWAECKGQGLMESEACALWML